MKISIITPAFNPGELILETFTSLKNQTYRDFEWIIVDDNSNKLNQEIYSKIKKTANFKVKIIRNESNFRQAKSKNIGLKNCDGDFIKFLDSDDLLDKNHLQNQLNVLINSSLEKCAVFSPTVNFYEHNGKNKYEVNYSYRSVLSENFSQLKRFIVFPFFSHCGCLFRKNTLLEINGFDNLITDEDGDLIVRLMFNNVLFLAEEHSFYYYRHHLNSRVSTNDTIQKWDHRLRVCKKIEKQINYHKYDLKQELAQRLDILAIEAYLNNYSNYNLFFKEAKLVYANYKYPHSRIQNSIRLIFGLKFLLFIKKLIRKCR